MRVVVATVHLVGLAATRAAWADENDPQIAAWLRGGQLRYAEPAEMDAAGPEPREAPSAASAPSAEPEPESEPEMEPPQGEAPEAEPEPKVPRRNRRSPAA